MGLMVEKMASCQEWLSSILEEKKRRNPSYSLRAFATKLGISAASLSQILSGKRRITKNMAGKIARSLNLPASKLSNLFQVAHPLDRPRQRKIVSNSPSNLRSESAETGPQNIGETIQSVSISDLDCLCGKSANSASSSPMLLSQDSGMNKSSSPRYSPNPPRGGYNCQGCDPLGSS